ncbi:MAG: preprotein translocase subunit SecE, partial [Chloroflexota bacterium]
CHFTSWLLGWETGLAAKKNVLVRFFNETKSELNKVKWPSRREATNLTVIVVITSVAVGAGLGIIDYIFEKLIFLIIPR